MYKLNSDNTIAHKIGTGEFHNVESSVEYLAWLEEGNTPEPADIPPVIIPTLTMRQARLALLDDGLLDEVEAAITTPSDRIWWDYSTTVERSHPLVNAVLTALGKTETEMDDMFIEANLI
jgi:hypothetical protein